MSCFRSAEFDVSCIAPAPAEGDFVLRRGKYFELGDYPDKEFSLSESEADEAVQSFTGAPINLEHTPTLFDGKLGRIRRLWREGRDLLAEYAIPAWLHAVTGGAPLRISSEWDRATKRPIGAALVLSPRIQDAVMMRGEEGESVSVSVSDSGGVGESVSVSDSGGGGESVSVSVSDSGGVGDSGTIMPAKAVMEPVIVASLPLSHCPPVPLSVLTIDDQEIAKGPNRAGKESRPMSLLARFTAFLRGEGLIDEREGDSVSVSDSDRRGDRETRGPGEWGTMGGGESGKVRHGDHGSNSGPAGAPVDREVCLSPSPTLPLSHSPAPSSSLQFAHTAEYRQMSQELTEQAAVIAELKADFVREYDKAAYISNLGELQELVRQGKMTAGESEQWRRVAADHPAAFTAVLETLKARPVLPQFSDHQTRRISPDPEAPGSRIVALTKERIGRTGERYEAAFSKVCRENPELAAQHAAAAPSYGGGA